MAELISARYSEYDGFVIAHGTDNLAYGAAALSCMIQGSGKPIVLTGSQQPMGAEDTDAKRNLYDAFCVAEDGSLGGVVVVFGGRIIDGRSAAKVHTWRYDAFCSINREQLGTVENGAVTLGDGAAEFTSHGGAPLFLCRMDTAVGLVKLVPAMSPAALDYAAEHCRVLIIEGYGMGGIPNSPESGIAERLRELILGGVIVVMTTQVREGGCDTSHYEVGQAAQACGVISAGQMTSEYAVMRAMWALAYANSTEDFKALFLR